MTDTPDQETNQGEATFAGDNFTRNSRYAVGLAETQVFYWDTPEK